MDNDKKTDETFDISLNNAKIKKFHDEELKKIAKENKLTYVDVYSLFANSSGKMNIQYTNDGLHLLGKGYMLWKEIITPYLKK